MSALSYSFPEFWLIQNYFVEYEISFQKKTFPALLGQPVSIMYLGSSRNNRVQGLDMKYFESDVGLGQGIR